MPYSSAGCRGISPLTGDDRPHHRSHRRKSPAAGLCAFGNGFTPLMHAAGRLDVEAVKLLLEFGVSSQGRRQPYKAVLLDDAAVKPDGRNSNGGQQDTQHGGDGGNESAHSRSFGLMAVDPS